MGSTWGTPRMTLWLHKHVAIPKVTFAAMVWWSRTKVASTGMELQCSQRASCIKITGVMRTTPTKIVEMFLDLFSLSTLVKAYYIRAHINPRKELYWKTTTGGMEVCEKQKGREIFLEGPTNRYVQYMYKLDRKHCQMLVGLLTGRANL